MRFVEIAKDGITGTATVPESALPHWTGHGWRLVDAEQPKAPTADAPAPQPEQTTTTEQPKASRRIPAATKSTEE